MDVELTCDGEGGGQTTDLCMNFVFVYCVMISLTMLTSPGGVHMQYFRKISEIKMKQFILR